MLKYIREYRFYITLFLFLLIPVIAIDTSSRSPRDYKAHDRAILWITYPVQLAVHWVLELGVDTYQGYIALWNTEKLNRELFEENRKLQFTVAQLREAQKENDRLKQILDFKEKNSLKTIVARVVAKDVSTEFRSLRINRGESSGVQKGMAVITHEGIVGRILRTTATTADIVTLLDLLSAVDAINERSRARGVVEGLTEDLCQLKFAMRTDDIKVGDLLLSSGLGGIYPKGIPVGVVSKVSKKTYGISQEVEVRPSVDFSKIEEVMIITEQKLTVTEKTEEQSPEKATKKQ